MSKKNWILIIKVTKKIRSYLWKVMIYLKKKRKCIVTRIPTHCIMSARFSFSGPSRFLFCPNGICLASSGTLTNLSGICMPNTCLHVRFFTKYRHVHDDWPSAARFRTMTHTANRHTLKFSNVVHAFSSLLNWFSTAVVISLLLLEAAV